jgi:uncharacterized membrane protein YedE/YeeE
VRYMRGGAFLCASGACARAYFRGRKTTIIILLSFLSVCCMRWIHYYILCLLQTPASLLLLLGLYLKLHLESVLSASTHIQRSSCSTIVSERVRVKGKKRYATKGHNEIYCHVCCMLLGKLEGTHTSSHIFHA